MTTSSSPIVFIVDDEEDMRLAMQRILKTVNLRAELFATAQDFLQRQIPEVPSCLVLLEVQQKLIEAGINIPIIFITAHGDIPMTVKAMKSGASESIHQALQRDQLSRRQRNAMAELQERYKGLTARERKVMDLVVSGMQTKQIASVLGTSEITAAVHRGRVMHKMQAGSPAELGSMAERLKPSANR